METYRLATFTSITGLFPVPADENKFYSEDEYVPYPVDLVKKWFETTNLGSKEEAAEHGYLDPLNYWLYETYMLSDTEDLFAYAKEHGCKWERNFHLCGKHYTLAELKNEYESSVGAHPDENPYAEENFWGWLEDLKECKVLHEQEITVTYTPEKKISKNSIPLLTEAVIEIVDAVDCICKAFRDSFEDSRDFNYTISQWAEEFLDWWDAEEDAGKDHLYLDEVWNFVERKVSEKMDSTYRVFYTMSGYVEVKARSEEAAKELASTMEITWDDRSVDFTDITKED